MLHRNDGVGDLGKGGVWHILGASRVSGDLRVSELHKRVPVSREEAFRFVEDDFAKVSSEVGQSLGCPIIDLGSV